MPKMQTPEAMAVAKAKPDVAYVCTWHAMHNALDGETSRCLRLYLAVDPGGYPSRGKGRLEAAGVRKWYTF